MQRNYLLVKGCAGLGNRMMTICSALNYAKRTNRTLIVDWTDGLFGSPQLNAFTNYFTLDSAVDFLPGFPDNIQMDKLSVYPKAFCTRLKDNLYSLYQQINHPFFTRVPLNKLHLLKLNQLNSCWVLNSTMTNVQRLTPMSYLKKSTHPDSFPIGSALHYNIKSDVVIFADYVCFEFLDNMKLIHLKSEVKHEIEYFSREKELHHAIGVHVRNTDLKPTKSIQQLIKKIEDGFGNGKIFLATDDINVIGLFRERFTEVIVFDKKMPQVKEKEGIHQWGQKNKDYAIADEILRSSIIDMYLLSQCGYLYYQGNSSFSVIANQLHAVPEKSVDWLSEK